MVFVPNPSDNTGPANDPLPIPITTYSLISPPVSQSPGVVNSSTPPPSGPSALPSSPAVVGLPPHANPPPPSLQLGGPRIAIIRLPPPTSSGDSTAPTTDAGLITGIVVGGLVGGVALGGVAAWLMRRGRGLAATYWPGEQQEPDGKDAQQLEEEGHEQNLEMVPPGTMFPTNIVDNSTAPCGSASNHNHPKQPSLNILTGTGALPPRPATNDNGSTDLEAHVSDVLPPGTQPPAPAPACLTGESLEIQGAEQVSGDASAQQGSHQPARQSGHSNAPATPSHADTPGGAQQYSAPTWSLRQYSSNSRT